MASLIARSISGVNQLTFAAVFLLLIHIQLAGAACGAGEDCSLNGKCAFSTETFKFGCECNAGFRGNGVNCTDVDECTEMTDDCDNLAICTNTEGGFTCSNCPPGYNDTTGDGKFCKEIDECESSPCKGDNSTCINTDGSFECQCPDGWSGDGITFCADGQACPDSSHICPMYSECKYDALSNEWACSCQSGFQSQGDECVDIDECLEKTDSCDNNAKCSNTLGSFTCTCKHGYEGDGTKCTGTSAYKNGTMTSALPKISTLSTKKLTITMRTTKLPRRTVPTASTTTVPKSRGSTTKTTATNATKLTTKMTDESRSSKTLPTHTSATKTMAPSTQTTTPQTPKEKSTATSTSTTAKEAPMTTTPSITTSIPVQTSTPTTKTTAVKTTPTTRTQSTTGTPSTTTKPKTITSTTTLIKISQNPTLKPTITPITSTTIRIQTSTSATTPKTTTAPSTTQTTTAKRSTTTPPTTTSKQTTAATQTTKEPTTSNSRTKNMTITTDISTQSIKATSMQTRSETPKPSLFTTPTNPITKTITAEKPSNTTQTHTIIPTTPATTASTKTLSKTTAPFISTTSYHNHSTSTQITRVMRRCPAKEMVDCPSFGHACSTSFYVREICPITCGTCDTKTGTTVVPTSPAAISTGSTVIVATVSECPDKEDDQCLSLKRQCKSSFYVRALCPISCGTCGTQITTANKAVSSGSQSTSTSPPITRKSTIDGSSMRTLPPCPAKEDLECVTLGKLCDKSFLVQVKCPISCGKCNSGTVWGSTSKNPTKLSTSAVSTGQNDTRQTVPNTTTKLATTQILTNNKTEGTSKTIPLSLPLRISPISTVDQFRLYRETMVERLEAYYQQWSNVSNADCVDISSIEYKCEVSWKHTTAQGSARHKRATSAVSDLDDFLTKTFENALKEKAKQSNITAPAIISPDGTTTSAGNELTTTDQPQSSTTETRPNTTSDLSTSAPSFTNTQGGLTTAGVTTVTDDGGSSANTTMSATEKLKDSTSPKPAGVLCPDMSNICSKNSKCGFSIPSGYQCQCKDGYTEDGNGVCTDVDECTLKTNNCDRINAKCLNTDGSFVCNCNSGFAGDGVVCTPSNETQIQTTASAVTPEIPSTTIPTKTPSTQKSTTASTPPKPTSKVTTTQVTTTPTTTTSSTSTTTGPPTTTTLATSPTATKTSSSTTPIPPSISTTTEDTTTSASASKSATTQAPTSTSIPTIRTTKTSTTDTPITKQPTTTMTTNATTNTPVSTSTSTPTITKQITPSSSITTTKEDSTSTIPVSASTQTPASSSTSTTTTPDASTPLSVSSTTTDATTYTPGSVSTSTLTTIKRSTITPSSITTITEETTTTPVPPSTATPAQSSKVTPTTTKLSSSTTQNSTAPPTSTTTTTNTATTPTVSASISTHVTAITNTSTPTALNKTTLSSNNTKITDTETTTPVANSTTSTIFPNTTTIGAETTTEDPSTVSTDLTTGSSSTQPPKIVTNKFQILPPVIKIATEEQYIVIRVAISYTVEGPLKEYYKSKTDLNVLCESISNTTYSCKTAYTESVTSSRRRRAVGSVPKLLLDNIQGTLRTNLQDSINMVAKDILSFKDRVTGVTDAELQQIQVGIDANSVTTDLIDSSKTITVVDLLATPLKQSTLPPVSTIATDVITTNKTCDFWWIGADCLDVDYKSSAFIGIMIACAILVIIVMITVVVAYHSRKKARGQRRGGKSIEDDLWINRDEDGDILNMRRISKLIPDDLDMKIPRAQIRESKDMNGNSPITNGGGEVQQSVRFNGAVAWSADKPRDPRIHSQDEITQLQSFAKGVPAADYVP